MRDAGEDASDEQHEPHRDQCKRFLENSLGIDLGTDDPVGNPTDRTSCEEGKADPKREL